ncbi:serine/threonine-protein kinase [Actinomadura madurae]|uniref:serine/threonine-protein kinase n=1 Tax=Actinomadura madurae TaxID=1993 RepID=UPI000DCFD16B|nr:serine/threonine-protein kinase [Actinomadura madurae]
MSAAGTLRPGDPERLGPYRLLGRLGEGGQGVVFLGEDERGTHGRVAVKLLNGGFGPETEARSRFLRELETAKRVAEFCTAAILDADVAGDRPYIVSELVDGPSLHRVVTAEGPRARGALERLAVGTATALVAIHRAGVVHRDFKPHNVLLGPDGPRVIDFGIARALDTGTITSGGAIGTPAYMAPEQLEGLRAGPAADVFAWAGTMVFASSGRLPFAADTMTAMVGRVMHGEPDLGELTGPLRDVAARCLAKDPAARPTASEVLRALLGDADQAPAPPASAGTRTMQAPPAPPAPPTPYAHPAPPGPPAPRDRRPVTGVVAVSAAVVAVAAAVVVTVLALSSGDGGGENREGPGASGRPLAATSGTAGATRPESPPSKTPSSPSPGTSGPENGIPQRYAGTWTGRLTQNDGKVFSARLVLPAGGAAGSIAYPEQNCSGSEIYLGESGGTLRFRERITFGTERCVDTGTLTLTPEAGGDRLMFRYVGRSSNGREWTVVGPLSRS